VLIFERRPHDPICQGKRLSLYLQPVRNASINIDYRWTWWDLGEPVELTRPRIECDFVDARALEAVSQAGTSGLPILLSMLKARVSLCRHWTQVLLGRLHLVGFAHLDPDPYGTSFRRRATAVAAIETLGPRATPVIPDLIHLLNDRACGTEALMALLAILPESQQIIQLTNAFRLPLPEFRGRAVLRLSTLGPAASPAMPSLLQMLNSTNEFLQGACAVALVRIGAPPEQVVPTVLRNLASNSNVFSGPFFGPTMEGLQMSLWTLGQYGRHATGALPVLLTFQTHSDPTVEVTARNAANRIRAAAASATP
jgi:hypothetical protein